MKRLILFTLLIVAALMPMGCEPAAESTPPSQYVRVLDETSFDAQVKSGVVLVDFWATWCGPCRTQGPIVDQVAEQMQGKVVVAKLDVDVAPTVAQRFDVRSIPTLIVFKDGKSVRRFTGVTSAEELTTAINAAIAAPE